jgi:hypothetical protein
MEVFDTEDCVRFASKVAGFAGAILSICPFESLVEHVPGRGQKQQSVDLGDKVMTCLTGPSRRGLETSCHVRYRSRKLTPYLGIEYRGKESDALNQIVRFVGQAALIPAYYGRENTPESGLCLSADFGFIEGQERLVHDDLLLRGELPIRPRAWPPDLPPDQEKPAPACNKPERVEPPIDAAAWCYMRFEFAKGSSFDITNPRLGQQSDCEDATIVVKGESPSTRVIGAVSSCKGGLPEDQAQDGDKTDHWTGRGWVGDVTIKAAGPERWAATARLRLFDHPFPSAVSIRSEPLARDDMRAFLLALSNGSFYPADCATSAVAGACDRCREIRANRERWHDPSQDLVRVFTVTDVRKSVAGHGPEPRR